MRVGNGDYTLRLQMDKVRRTVSTDQAGRLGRDGGGAIYYPLASCFPVIHAL